MSLVEAEIPGASLGSLANSGRLGAIDARTDCRMTRRWLVLCFRAPLMALGDITIDQVGPTRDFPSASMLTGLLANALGWHWSERQRPSSPAGPPGFWRTS